jgi:hypothetical protein
MNEPAHDNWIERDDRDSDMALRRKYQFCMKRHLAPIGAISPAMRAYYHARCQVYYGLLHHGF